MAAVKVWKGSPSLAKRLALIDSLTPHPRNRRRGDVERIARSLDAFGQLKAVVVDADSTVLAGHHVIQAARKLGWTHVAVDTTDLTGDAALAFLIADNRLSDIATWDEQGLIGDLNEITLDLALVAGYTPDEVEALIEKVNAEVEGAGDPPAPGGGSTLTCPNCGYVIGGE